MRDASRRAALSLGANLGDATGAFVHALQRLTQADRTRATAVSSVYRTAPWGRTDQPDFLNMAAMIETRLEPHDLLVLCLAIERERGRVRRERWAPRTLDVDIVDYAGLIVSDPELTLPHPQACARAFVLIPLVEIAPDLRIGDKSVRELAAACDASGVLRDEAATARLRSMLAPG